MIDFPIIEQAKNKIRIKVVSGYKIPKTQEFACFKEGKSNWVIIDLESGMFLAENIRSLTDCFSWWPTADLNKINKAKKTKRYKAYKNILSNWKINNNI